MNYSCAKEEFIFVYMYEQTVSCIETEQIINEDHMRDDNK